MTPGGGQWGDLGPQPPPPVVPPPQNKELPVFYWGGVQMTLGSDATFKGGGGR